MLTNEESFLIKTIRDTLYREGIDTSEIDKAMSITLKFDDLPPDVKVDIEARIPGKR